MILIDDKVDMFCVWLWFPHSCWCCLERSWMCFPFALFSRKLQASHILTDRSQPRPQPETRTWIIWIIHDDPWLSKYPYVGWNRFWFSPPASWESLLHWSKSYPCEALCLAPVGWVLRIHEDSVSNIFHHVFLGASEMHLIVIYGDHGVVASRGQSCLHEIRCDCFSRETGWTASTWKRATKGQPLELRTTAGETKDLQPLYFEKWKWNCPILSKNTFMVWKLLLFASLCLGSYTTNIICIYDPFQAGGCGLLWSYPGWCCNTCCGALHSDRSCAQEVQFKNNKEIDA